jgi:hypothetical protein
MSNVWKQCPHVIGVNGGGRLNSFPQAAGDPLLNGQEGHPSTSWSISGSAEIFDLKDAAASADSRS